MGDQTHGFLTWGDIKERCARMTDEELAQPFECDVRDTLGMDAKTQELYGAIHIETQHELSHDQETGETFYTYRSVDDNGHHPERLVVLLDVCHFSEDGDTYYTLNDDASFTGNVSGKVKSYGTNT